MVCSGGQCLSGCYIDGSFYDVVTFDVTKYRADPGGHCGDYVSGGTTYNTDLAIQTAIADGVAAQQGGCPNVEIYFPAGTYCATRTIVNNSSVTNNWTYAGDGPTASVIESAGGVLSPPPSSDFNATYQPLFVAYGAATDHVAVQNLGFRDLDHRCRQHASATDTGQGTSLVQFAGFGVVNMTNVDLEGGQNMAQVPRNGNYCDGIALTSVAGGMLSNVQVTDAGKAGIYIAGGGRDGITVSNSTANYSSNGSLNAGTGVAIANAQNVTLDTVTASGNQNFGIIVVTEGGITDIPCSSDAACQELNADFYCLPVPGQTQTYCGPQATNITIDNCVTDSNGLALVQPPPDSGPVNAQTPLHQTFFHPGLAIWGWPGSTDPTVVSGHTQPHASWPRNVTVNGLTSDDNIGSGIAISGGTGITIIGASLTSNAQGGIAIYPPVFWAGLADGNGSNTWTGEDPVTDAVTVQGGSIITTPLASYGPYTLDYPGAGAIFVQLQNGPGQPQGVFGTVTFGGGLAISGTGPALQVPTDSMSNPGGPNLDVLNLEDVTMSVLAAPGPSHWMDVGPGGINAPVNGTYVLEEMIHGVNPNGALYAPLGSTYASADHQWQKNTAGTSNMGWTMLTSNGCANGATPDQIYGLGMVACGGSVTYANAASLCDASSGYVPCTAAEWVVRPGGGPPVNDYWLADNLNWVSGGTSGNCETVDYPAGNPCGDGPMMICAHGGSDTYGNECNSWLGCGFDSTANQYLGGCNWNPNDPPSTGFAATAGTMCCLGASAPLASACSGDAFAEQMFVPGVGGCAGSVPFDNAQALCAAGCTVCSAQQWQSKVIPTIGGNTPQYDYWVSNAPDWSGSGSQSCAALASGGNACGNNAVPGDLGPSPMRVCVDHGTIWDAADPLGNTCNWDDCGLGDSSPNVFLGGCGPNNPTAGALCCCGN
jgi:hypothetical protein